MSYRGPLAGRRPCVRAGSVSVGGDPFFSNVVLLIGNNNGAGTTFIDQSAGARTVTTVGSTVWDATTAPSGLSSSILFDGAGDRLTIADEAAFEPGAGAWTVEFFIKRTANNVTDTVACKSVLATSLGPWLVQATAAGAWSYYASSTGAAWNLASNISFGASSTNWAHVAYTGDGSTLRGFVDGVKGATDTAYAAALVDNAADVCLGALQGGFGQDFQGNMAAFRYTIGVARYTANFTPPTLPLPTN